MTEYKRAFLGLEFWMYMNSPHSVLYNYSPIVIEEVPHSEYAMSCGTEG